MANLRSIADHQLFIFRRTRNALKQMIILFHPRSRQAEEPPLSRWRFFLSRPCWKAKRITSSSTAIWIRSWRDHWIGSRRSTTVELLAVSVMPGPQMVAAIPFAANSASQSSRVPIVWGGYFPSLYTDAALNAQLCRFRDSRSGRRNASPNCSLRFAAVATLGSDSRTFL